MIDACPKQNQAASGDFGDFDRSNSALRFVICGASAYKLGKL